MVYIDIFGQLFYGLIKMVYWLLDHILTEHSLVPKKWIFKISMFPVPQISFVPLFP